MNRLRLLVPFVILALVTPAFAGKTAPKPATKSAAKGAVTSLDEALKQAKEGKRLIFIQSGRELCGNCQHLRGLIADGKVSLPKGKFVYADLNCDDKEASASFRSKFKVTGTGLPFVVVADSEGRQLAARSGYGEAKDYNDLIREATKAAKALPATPAAK